MLASSSSRMAAAVGSITVATFRAVICVEARLCHTFSRIANNIMTTTTRHRFQIVAILLTLFFPGEKIRCLTCMLFGDFVSRDPISLGLHNIM